MRQAHQAHGSIPYRELRRFKINPRDIVDFSATVNPFPLPDAITHQLTIENIAAYPDTECFEAIEALGRYHDISPERIIMTAGITETIFILPLLFDSAIQFSPTYGDYAAAFKRHHKKLHFVNLPETSDTFEGCIDELHALQCPLLIICNPNNPDGKYLQPESIRHLCRTFPNTIICVDESYQEMSTGCTSMIYHTRNYPNLLVLKSLTKPFGIGGIRAAYALSSGSILGEITNLLLPWGVSLIAQRIIPLLIDHVALFQKQWRLLEQEKEFVVHNLGPLFSERHGACPFLLLNTGNAESIRRALLEKYRVVVRDCASFGMPAWIRVMPGPRDRSELLIRVLREVAGHIPKQTGQRK